MKVILYKLPEKAVVLWKYIEVINDKQAVNVELLKHLVMAVVMESTPSLQMWASPFVV